MHLASRSLTAALAVALIAGGCDGDLSKSKFAPKKERRTRDTALDRANRGALTDASGARRPKGSKQVTPPFDIKTPPADAERLPSGMVFKSIVEGTGAAPGRNDGVRIRYSGWAEDGRTFATTEPTDEPTVMYLYGTAIGFTEALRKMKIGGTAMFWLPPSIGYPGKPRDKPEQLAYAVELVDVIAAPPTPPDLTTPPADARREPSGVTWTMIERNPAGEHPERWDAVAVHYSGWDAGGKIVDSSEVHEKPVEVMIENLPAVFADVVPLLHVGDRARLWFDAAAFGAPPSSASSATGQLCFEVEIASLTRLVKPPEAPPDVAKPPPGARTTPKGVAYQVLTAGTGTRTAKPTDTVKIHVTGWTTDGKRFESTIPRGKPTELKVTGAIAGWTDVLQLMVAGDHWRIWVPEELAFKGAPQRPQGTLVYELQLLEIVGP